MKTSVGKIIYLFNKKDFKGNGSIGKTRALNFKPENQN
jgi:hypothetical protein